MFPVKEDDGRAHSADHAAGNSVYAALGRTLTRSLALYFSRPVRIFKPVKGMFDTLIRTVIMTVTKR